MRRVPHLSRTRSVTLMTQGHRIHIYIAQPQILFTFKPQIFSCPESHSRMFCMLFQMSESGSIIVLRLLEVLKCQYLVWVKSIALEIRL